MPKRKTTPGANAPENKSETSGLEAEAVEPPPIENPTEQSAGEASVYTSNSEDAVTAPSGSRVAPRSGTMGHSPRQGTPTNVV